MRDRDRRGLMRGSYPWCARRRALRRGDRAVPAGAAADAQLSELSGRPAHWRPEAGDYMLRHLEARMSSSLIQRDKAEAKKKGMYAAAAWGGTVLLGVASGAVLWVPAAVGAGYLT